MPTLQTYVIGISLYHPRSGAIAGRAACTSSTHPRGRTVGANENVACVASVVRAADLDTLFALLGSENFLAHVDLGRWYLGQQPVV